jgi:hypothetical protein
VTPTEAKRLKKRLHEQYLRDVASIDRVLELSQRGANRSIAAVVAAQPDTTARLAGPTPFGHSNPDFENEIMKIIDQKIMGEFKITDVVKVVGESRPDLAGKRSTISFAVSGLAKRGNLLVMQQGRGRRPGIYRRSNEASLTFLK